MFSFNDTQIFIKLFYKNDERNQFGEQNPSKPISSDCANCLTTEIKEQNRHFRLEHHQWAFLFGILLRELIMNYFLEFKQNENMYI